MSDIKRVKDRKDVAEREAIGVMSSWYSSIRGRAVDSAGPDYTLNEEEKDRLAKKLLTIYAVTQTMVLIDDLNARRDPVLLDFKRKIKQAFDSEFGDRRAVQAGYIAASTEREIQRTFIGVLQDAQERRETLSGGELKRRVDTVLKSRFKNKTKLDAVTETNWSAEATRRTVAKTATQDMIERAETARSGMQLAADDVASREADNVQKIAKYAERDSAGEFASAVVDAVISDNAVAITAAIASFRDGMKEWITMEDAKVRPTHMETQLSGAIQIDELFLVGTSLMMYPGDSSMGAEIGEIINCRCSVNYL